MKYMNRFLWIENMNTELLFLFKDINQFILRFHDALYIFQPDN